MKILSIGTGTPSLEMTNEDILADIRSINTDVPGKVVEQYIRILRTLLNKTGSQTRFWRNRESGETTNQLLLTAMESALAESGLQAADIDMLIYCGVGRGFIEPGNAYFCAKMMDMKCACFDISDACMSYVRALEIAQGYLASDKYKNILIVNAECTVYECGYPDLFKINSLDQLQYTYPAYTIGEAATATVVSSDGDDWTFDYDSVPGLADLCTIPAAGYKSFMSSNDNVGQNGVGHFVSFSSDLFKNAVEGMTRLARNVVTDISGPDIWFPHTASEAPCNEIAELLGIDKDSMYIDTFRKHGNLASASIPMAMSTAYAESKLKRGMKVALAPASAGMSFAIVQFTY